MDYHDAIDKTLVLISMSLILLEIVLLSSSG